MEALLKPVFSVLSVPDVKIRRPGWFKMPTSNQTLFFILVSYFLVTGGVIYDVIVEPPSMGSTTDEHGHSRPVAFMQYRINGQYIVEGLSSRFHYPGSDPLCWHAKAQSHDAPTHRLLSTLCLFLMLLDIYEDETTRLPAQLEK